MGRSAWHTDTSTNDFAFVLKMKLRFDQMRVEKPTSALASRAQGLSEPLTEREQEILACLADQLSNQEIANKLHLAEKTVRWYNTQIYRKLGAGSRKEAIEQARRAGLLGGTRAPPVKHNLPYPSTPLVGRQRELAKLTALLASPDARLVTILAPGGMGKTCLSLEVARTLLRQYADGVFFVPLAALGDVADIVFAIAEQVGLIFYGQDAPSQQLLDFLRVRSLLLVLDNFEHLLEAAQVVADILRAAPDVHVLVTSRERLGLQGETVYILRGLDFQMWQNPQEIGSSDAAGLFVQCARRVRPDFTLQAGDLENLARIFRLTDGMPLALELAAGWLNTFSLGYIADEIQKGIGILESELRDVPERHRSIRATFDHTWLQLSEAERQVFMHLSVFRGGWTREAAEAVAAADRHSLRGLSNKALIEGLDGGRYGMHELLQQFGAEKLAQSGQGSLIQAKHTAFFTDLMVQCGRDSRTSRQGEVVQQLASDFENVRVAWLDALERQAWEGFCVFLDPLWFYCRVRALHQVGIELIEHAALRVRSTPATAATELILGRLLARLGRFYFSVGLMDKSAAAGDEAIRILRQYDSPQDLLAALDNCRDVAQLHRQTNTMMSVLEEGIGLARSVGDRNWEGHFLIAAAIAASHRNDLTSTRLLAEEGLAIAVSLGDQLESMVAYEVLGHIAEAEENFSEAAVCFQTKLDLAQAIGYRVRSGASITHLAYIALQQQSVGVARLYLREALRTVLDAGYLWQSTVPLACAARILAQQNQWLRSVEILGAIDEHLTAFHQVDKIAHALRDELAGKLEPQDFAAAWERGQRHELSALIKDLLLEFSESADSGDPPITTWLSADQPGERS